MKHRVVVSALLAAFVAACGGDGKVTEPRSTDRLTALAAIGTDPSTGATIETDKDDYAPGEIVHLSGHRWAANETVHLVMTEDPNTHNDIVQDVETDSTGAFSLHFYDVQEHDLGVTFTLTATGRTSGSVATVVFTDSRTITKVELLDPATNTYVVSPAQVSLSASGTLTVRVTGTTDNTGGGGGAADDWQSTRWRVRGPAPGNGVVDTNCSNTIDISVATAGAQHVFTIPVPAGAGTYSIDVTAFRTDGCVDNPSNSVDYADGLIATPAAAIATTTTVQAAPTPSVFGEAVTFTATVTPASGPAATGTVNFYEFTGAQTCSALGGAVALGTATTAPFAIVLSALSVASHTITACYTPNAGWTASSGSVSHSVGKANVSVAVADAPTSSNVGASVTFTATVTAAAPGAGTPTGTVTFFEFTGAQTCTNVSGATPLATVNAAPYEFSTTALTAGNHTITACYGGDTNFNPGSGSDTHSVSLITTTTAIASSVNPSVTGQSVTFTATVTHGASVPATAGTVQFKVGGANCTDALAVDIGSAVGVNGSGQANSLPQIYPASQSPKVVHACYSGTPSFATSEASLTQVINRGQTGTVVTSVPASPSVFGQSVTFTATVTATSPAAGTPTGSVTFYDGGSCASPGTTLASVTLNAMAKASVSTSSLAVGDHSIVACYAGDVDFFGSEGSLAFTVNKAATTTGLQSSANPSTFGDPVTFTATVTVTPPGAGTPTGTVKFSVGGTCDPSTGNITGGTPLATKTIGSGPLTVTTSDLTAGSHTIVACYSGDGNFNGSGNTLTQQVQPKPTTTTATVETADPQYSDEVKLKAVVSPHVTAGSELTGTVTFYINGSVNCAAPPATSAGSDVIAAADDGVAEIEPQILLAAGAYTVTACFTSSNTNFANSSDDVPMTLYKEDAAVAPASPYGNAFSVGSGGTATFTLAFTVRERNPEPDANAGALPGDIDNAGLSVTLNAVGSGANSKTVVCTSGTIPPPLSYSDVKTYTCVFSAMAVDAYEVDAHVTGNHYVGTYVDALTVYDPGAGFVTGGGKWVYPDASSDRVSFGLSFTFTGKGKTIPRGNLVVIRHLANGDVCRVKSNAIDAPAVAGKTASFSGKGNYGCVRPNGETYDGIGNQTILGWVEDNGEGSNATGPDRFWINMNVPSSKLLLIAPASSNAQPLTGGNVQVPQPSSGR